MLHRLVDAGNTVIVIEHNLDVIKTADHVIDLGPAGGNGGGEVIAIGTPEEIAVTPASATGEYLRALLGKRVRCSPTALSRPTSGPGARRRKPAAAGVR